MSAGARGRPPVRRRLLVRIYFAAMLAVATVVFVLVVVRTMLAPPPLLGRLLPFLLQTMPLPSGDPGALNAELRRARLALDIELTLYATDGTLLGTASAGPPPPLSPDRAATLPEAGAPLRPDRWAFPVSKQASVYAIVEFLLPAAPGLGIEVATVLLVMGVGSLLLARTIGRPLERIAATARALGSGTLDVRVGMKRQDEIGELSRSFDEMAERITQLIARERELLASVSHELRTPLARIRMALDLAEEGDAAAREALKDITGDLVELERLVEDVLTMARLEARVENPRALSPLRAQQVDAHALVEGALARFRALHPARVVTTTAPSTPILIEVDAGLVRRVIENLLDNGHKHSPPERPLALALSSAGGRARFQVADQGEGIAPEDLPHVFDPFFRADRSRARASGGAGLGLPLARRVVEAHGGTITIESQPGQGTTVTFELPPG